MSKSRWAQFKTDRPIQHLDERAVSIWTTAKIEFMTHVKEPDDTFRFVVKSENCLRSSKWGAFVKSVNGTELSVAKVNKYHTPLDDLRGGPKAEREQEAKENVFTLAKNAPVPAAPASAGRRGKRGRTDALLGLFQPGGCDPRALVLELERVFGEVWKTSPNQLLQSYMTLEAHRRVLRLERIVYNEDDRPDAAMLEVRAKAVAAHRYFVVDPLTFAVPTALERISDEKFDLASQAGFRLNAVALDLTKIFRYGMLLSKRARSKPGLIIPENLMFDRQWLPQALVDMMDSPTDRDVADRRRRHETLAARECMKGGIPVNSPLVAKHNLMLRRATVLFPADTLELSYTRFLPPTQSMPEASYDPEAFCKQVVVNGQEA